MEMDNKMMEKDKRGMVMEKTLYVQYVREFTALSMAECTYALEMEAS